MAHIKLAKQLYKEGYCVYNTEIVWNGVKKIPISPPKTGTMTYEDCEQYIGKSWTVNGKKRLTNAVVLLTGIRQGNHPELKHCICLDLDNAKNDEIDGDRFIKKHKKLFSDTYIENTGNGGKHYIYLLDANESNHTIKNDGDSKRLQIGNKDYSIDILANSSCVILAPSKYRAGDEIKEYVTDMNFIDDINYIPDKLYNMLNITEDTNLIKEKKRKLPGKKVRSRQSQDNNDDVEYNENEFKQAQFLLKNLIKHRRFDGREAWISLGYALKQYGNKGLELYHEISAKSDKYDENDTIYTFSTFGDSYADINYFYKMAYEDKPRKFEEFREKELCIIEGDYIDDLEVHRLRKIYIKLATDALLKDGVRVNSQTIKKRLHTMGYFNKVVEYLNHYLVLDESGYCYLIEIVYSNGRRIKFINRRNRNNFIDSYSSIKQELLFWIDSPEKSKTRQVIFRPTLKMDKSIRNEFNKFLGYKFEYKDNFVVDMEKINIILDHIKKVLFNDKEILYNFYFQVLHEMFTNPAKKTGILINMLGKQGIGKSIITELLDSILNGNSVSISSKDRLTQQFNSLLQNKLLITVEECAMVGKEKHDFFDQLKARVTNKTTISEAKFADAQEVEDFSNYHFISNNPYNTKIESTEDRRVFCNEANNEYIMSMTPLVKKAYFNRLAKAKDSDDVQEHFFHFICQFDKGISLMSIPESESRRRQINLSADSVIKYICSKFPTMIRKDIKISGRELYQSYELCTKRNGESVVSNKYMVTMLKQYLPSLKVVKSCGVMKYKINDYLNNDIQALKNKYCMNDEIDDDSDNEFLSDCE